MNSIISFDKVKHEEIVKRYPRYFKKGSIVEVTNYYNTKIIKVN